MESAGGIRRAGVEGASIGKQPSGASHGDALSCRSRDGYYQWYGYPAELFGYALQCIFLIVSQLVYFMLWS